MIRDVCKGLSECHKGHEGVNVVAPVLHYVLDDTLFHLQSFLIPTKYKKWKLNFTREQVATD